MSKENGTFLKSGDSNVLDLKFCSAINEFLLIHQIQSVLPVKVEIFKIPIFIYSKYNYESFSRLMNKYAKKCMAVLWGVIDLDGNIKHFEVSLRENIFRDQNIVNKFISDLKNVTESPQIDSNSKIQFLSYALAAMWGHSFCDILVADNKWQLSLWLATNSEQLFKKAISVLEQIGAEKVESIIIFENKRFLPLYLRQQAICLWSGGQYEEALNKLIDSLIINPLWPLYDLEEFKVFYNNRYAWELSGYESLEYLKEAIPSYKKRGLVDTPPNFQMFIDYLRSIPIDIKDLMEKIDKWFLGLSEKYDNNPFILIYWADAIKTPFFIDNSQKIKELDIKSKFNILPLDILNQVIPKIEKAYDISPNMPVIASRLSALYMQKLAYYKQGTDEYINASNMVGYYLKIGKQYLLENIPGAFKDMGKN